MTLYAPPASASTDQLRDVWLRAFGSAMSTCGDGDKAKRIANGTIKRLVKDADGRKSPGNVTIGSKRAWNAAYNAARAARMNEETAAKIASGVSGTRARKGIPHAMLTVLRAARKQGVL